MIIDHYRNYCENEFTFISNTLHRNFYTPKEVIDNAIQRLLGAGDFAQQMGAAYDEIEQMFNEYKEKMQKLLK